MKKFYQLKANDEKNELYIYGDITSIKWEDSDVSSFDLAQELAEISGDLIVRINSCGGEISEGLAIYNLLKNYNGKVTTICDGFACSIASVIFMAGQERIMPTTSMLFIHNAWTSTCGNSEELKKASEDLDKLTQPSIDIYLECSNLNVEQIKEMMNEEVWISATEALNFGFATSITQPVANQSLTDFGMMKIIQENKELKNKLLTMEAQPIIENVQKEEDNSFNSYFNRGK